MPGDHGDHGTSVSDKIDQKTKVGQNNRLFLRIFFPQLILTTGSSDSSPVCLMTCGDHSDNGTSLSDEIDQKTKVDKNTRLFS